MLIEHTKLFEEKLGLNQSEGLVARTGSGRKPVLGAIKNFAIMKKHYKAYVHGFDGAKELRVELMECEKAGEVETMIKDFLESFAKK